MKTVKNKTSKYFIDIFAGILILFLGCQSPDNSLSSPDGTVQLILKISDKGEPFCQVFLNDKKAISSCQLGLVREDDDFVTDLKLRSGSSIKRIKDSYELKVSKKKTCHYLANQRIFHFENTNGKKLDVIFQLSNDGLAFRYYFPDSTNEIKKIVEEKTMLNFQDSTRTWIQPMALSKSGWCQVNPSYEEYYEDGVLISELADSSAGWIFPALLKSGDIWMAITETAPDKNYCGSRLQKKGDWNFQIGFPDSTEHKENGPVNPESSLPWYSPWRIITISDNLGTIVESTLGTDLAEPAKDMDFSFVKPGRSSWSWVLLKDDSTLFDVQKKFIDYASNMNWEYCLIDCFWDKQIGMDRIIELAKYAKTKHVGIWLWYNSSGDWNSTILSPKDRLLTREGRQVAFRKLQEIGIKGIKVDFFGADGQSMMSYYQEIIEDAAKFGLMVNCHGATLPRGMHRTYPNLLTMEAIRGFEFVTFEQPNADKQAKHCTFIPFTRNLFDPMDFTPVCFGEIPYIKRLTGNCFEMATSVLFISGVQHFAEKPEVMYKMPTAVQDFMRNVPVTWDETRFIDGYPGAYVVIARRKDKTWYVAGVNGDTQAKNVSMTLDFIDSDKSKILFADEPDKRSFKIKKDISLENSKLELKLKPKEGFVLKVN